MAVKRFVVGQLQTNCYLFYDPDSREAVIIDPGDDADLIINKIKDLGLNPQAILGTHAHFDHLLAATELKLAFQIPFYLHKDELPILKRLQSSAQYFLGLKVDPPSKVDHFLSVGKEIKVGKLKLKTIASPGHTPGGVCFWSQKEKLIFSGDTIFAGGAYGRTDLAGGNYQSLIKSIEKILKLPPKTVIYSGHGPITTIEQEKGYYKK